MNEVLRRSSDKKNDEAGEGMASITEFLQDFYEIDLLKESLIRGFHQALGVNFMKTQLTEEERQQTSRLIENRYRSREWNLYRRS